MNNWPMDPDCEHSFEQHGKRKRDALLLCSRCGGYRPVDPREDRCLHCGYVVKGTYDGFPVHIGSAEGWVHKKDGYYGLQCEVMFAMLAGAKRLTKDVEQTVPANHRRGGSWRRATGNMETVTTGYILPTRGNGILFQLEEIADEFHAIAEECQYLA